MGEPRKLWNLECGYTHRDVIYKSSSLNVIKYKIKHSSSCNLIGRRLVFFADLHYSGEGDLLCEELIETVNCLAADWIVFGGDLIRHSIHLDKALGYLAAMKANLSKVAIYGNWDRRRRDWFPHYVLKEAYAKAGFELLINECFQSGEISFYGIDDFKAGFPEMKISNSDKFNCILSHNPDSIVDDRFTKKMNFVNLALCGHTHGGQIRVPGFGALVTSSIHHKKFEYGHYSYKKSPVDMIITSGIGTSALPIRLFCKPEVVLIDF